MKRRLLRIFRRFPAPGYTGPLLVFILIEGLFSFCSRTCPAFEDAAFQGWFPYQEGQKTYFTSSLGAKDTITIRDVYASESRTAGFLDKPCAPYTYIYSESDTGNRMKLSVSFSKEYAGNTLYVSLYGFLITGALVAADSLAVPYPLSSAVLPTATINGQMFSRVLQVQRDTAMIKDTGIYKVWFAKGMGLVGYEHYPSREQWAKN